MSEYDYKTGQDHANKGWQPSPPDPGKTWVENNAYQNGYTQQNNQNNQNNGNK
jgi:hypothetical protein